MQEELDKGTVYKCDSRIEISNNENSLSSTHDGSTYFNRNVHASSSCLQ